MPNNEDARYELDLYSKQNLLNNSFYPRYIETKSFDRYKLRTLNEDNFAENTGLGFDIKDRSQVRDFAQRYYFMKARLRNMILLSFDNEDTLNCQNWSLDIMFDFHPRATVVVTKQVEYTKIKCKHNWKDYVGYIEEEYDVKVRQQVILTFIVGITFLQYRFDAL